MLKYRIKNFRVLKKYQEKCNWLERLFSRFMKNLPLYHFDVSFECNGLLPLNSIVRIDGLFPFRIDYIDLTEDKPMVFYAKTIIKIPEDLKQYHPEYLLIWIDKTQA